MLVRSASILRHYILRHGSRVCIASNVRQSDPNQRYFIGGAERVLVRSTSILRHHFQKTRKEGVQDACFLVAEERWVDPLLDGFAEDVPIV